VHLVGFIIKKNTILYLGATHNHLQFTCYMYRPVLGYDQELPITRKSYQGTMLRVINSVMNFLINYFDWNLVKVCSLQDIVKQYGRVNNYYLILCVYFRRCEPGAPLWPLLYFFFLMAQQPPVGQHIVFVEVSKSHSDTPNSVRLFWTSDLSVVETST
jgi:hypothetical protein